MSGQNNCILLDLGQLGFSMSDNACLGKRLI
jgi:hypothetical protein